MHRCFCCLKKYDIFYLETVSCWVPPTLISRCSLLSFSPLLFIVLMEFVCKNVWLPSCIVATLFVKFRIAKHDTDTNVIVIILVWTKLLVFCHTSSKTSLPRMRLFYQCYQPFLISSSKLLTFFLAKKFNIWYLLCNFNLNNFCLPDQFFKNIFHQSW